MKRHIDTMNSKIIVIVLLVAVSLGGAFYYYSKNVTPDSGTPVACTQEAKLCADGSSVGRSGPNCAFAECPTISEKEVTTAALNQKILNKGVFLTPLEVLSDSRCPVDVECVQAGEITVKVLLEKGSVSKEVVLKLQSPVVFEGSKISLTAVTPENKSNETYNKTNYRFTFLVTSITPIAMGTVSGTVTTSPTCPVERIPPEPQCSPKPYATSIRIREEGKQVIVKTIQSNNLGMFSTDLPVGSYTFDAISVDGKTFPKCNAVTVLIKSNQDTIANISCDTGIR